MAPFLFEQCPRTLSNELTVVHLLLFKGIFIGVSSLLYTWHNGSRHPLIPESVAFALDKRKLGLHVSHRLSGYSIYLSY